jgi:hypothetical protein
MVCLITSEKFKNSTPEHLEKKKGLTVFYKVCLA